LFYQRNDMLGGELYYISDAIKWFEFVCFNISWYLESFDFELFENTID